MERRRIATATGIVTRTPTKPRIGIIFEWGRQATGQRTGMRRAVPGHP